MIQESIRNDLDALQKRVDKQDFESAARALLQRKYATESAVFQKVLRERTQKKDPGRVRATPKTSAFLPQSSDEQHAPMEQGYGDEAGLGQELYRELGQELYRKIQPKEGQLAGRITEMILELKEQEIRRILRSDQDLDAKIKETRQVLQRYVRKKLQERGLPPWLLEKITTEPLHTRYELVQDHPRFNVAVNALGLDRVLGLVERMLESFPDKVLISVGSGGARLEKEIADRHPGRTVVCVDPIPWSYTHALPLLWPRFRTSQDARDANLTDQLLLLDWPDPNNTYDIRALSDLKPVMCVVITDMTGGAGSQDLNSMMWYGFGEGYTIITREHVNERGFLGLRQYSVGLFAQDDVFQGNQQFKTMNRQYWQRLRKAHQQKRS